MGQLNYLIESEDVPESEIVWAGVDYFLREHDGHGDYDLNIFVNGEGRIGQVSIECEGVFAPPGQCSHRDAPIVELGDSTFYSLIKSELCSDLQRQRREGTLDLG